MEQVGSVLSWVVANYQVVVASLLAILGGVIGVCLLIPGEQPEKALQGVVDFLSKFSKK